MLNFLKSILGQILITVRLVRSYSDINNSSIFRHNISGPYREGTFLLKISCNSTQYWAKSFEKHSRPTFYNSKKTGNKNPPLSTNFDPNQFQLYMIVGTQF